MRIKTYDHERTTGTDAGGQKMLNLHISRHLEQAPQDCGMEAETGRKGDYADSDKGGY